MKKKTTGWVWIALVVLALILSACASPPEVKEVEEVGVSPEPIALTDGLGRSVTLDGPAQRIVSLAPSNTEILFAVGAGDQVVARDEFADYPEEAKALPSIGGSFGEYNTEAIVDLQPDLVMAAEINSAEQVKALEDLGLTVYYLSNPVDIEGMYANLEIVAELTGHQAETATLIESLKGRVAAVDEKIAGVQEKPLVFYELDSTDPSAPYTAGPGTFVDLLIDRAGGENLGASLAGSWAQISVEDLLVRDPKMIVLGDAVFGVTVESVGTRPGWDSMSAVQNGQVFPFDDNLVSRPGPRLVDGLEQLAKLIHPEAFE